MSYFRSYFEKNNTIIKKTSVNTAKNPTTEIFYGSSFSKFIFKVDFSDLKNRINSGEFVIDSNTKHYLKMTNTIFGNETFLGAPRGNSKKRASSFDLILFKISEFWDEGVGFDYEYDSNHSTMGNNTYDERPSNWSYRTTLYTWEYDGIYSDSPDIVSTIHFDNGNENLNVDITDYVNGILLSGNTNHGLGVAFSNDYENINPDVDRSVAFFSKYTQTFFEPFVETIFVDNIVDNRNNFIEKFEQNLFLYVTKTTNFYDLDTTPTVDILDSNGSPIDGLTGLTTTKIRKGVYKVTFSFDGLNCDGKKFFYDRWTGLEIDTVSIPDVTQKFIPKPFTSTFTIGANQTDYNNYSVQISGIKQNEKIKRGELRKIVVDFKSINTPKTELFNEVYYRMFIKEGRVDVIVHEWTQLDVTNENSFMLDTSIYIPREYYIEIKGRIHGQEIFYKEFIKFEILSEK
jgi:hypothetical protein